MKKTVATLFNFIEFFVSLRSYVPIPVFAEEMGWAEEIKGWDKLYA
jgi:hypothetical protein